MVFGVKNKRVNVRVVILLLQPVYIIMFWLYGQFKEV